MVEAGLDVDDICVAIQCGGALLRILEYVEGQSQRPLFLRFVVSRLDLC